MKIVLFTLAVVAGFSISNAQIVLFEDDFESYEDFIIDGIGNWIVIDEDGAPTYSYSGDNTDYPNSHAEKAWQIFNPSQALNLTTDSGENWDPHSGEKYIMAWAAVDVQNSDWLITPAITLGNSDNVVEFYVKALSHIYSPEEYEFYVYEGTGVPSTTDFSWEDSNLIDGDEGWRKDSYNLDVYAGKTVRIAIRYNSNDMYGLLVDDFKVTTGSLGVSDLSAKASSVYPNPVVDTFNVDLSSKFNASNLTVTITDLSGKTVKTFAAADSYNVSDLAKGVYLVTITDGKNTETKKIVKR